MPKKRHKAEEIVAKLRQVEVLTAQGKPTVPWENGYCESFNSKLRDELLNGEMFYTMKEARVVIETWRRQFPKS